MLYPLHSCLPHMACGTHTCSSSSPDSHSALGSGMGCHHTCLCHCIPQWCLPGRLNLLALSQATPDESPQTHLWSSPEKQAGGLIQPLLCPNPSSRLRLQWRGFDEPFPARGEPLLAWAVGLRLWNLWGSFLQCRAVGWGWPRRPAMLPPCATCCWTDILGAAEPACWSLDPSGCGDRDARRSAQCWAAGRPLCAAKACQHLFRTWSWMSHLEEPLGLEAESLCTCSLETQMKRQ